MVKKQTLGYVFTAIISFACTGANASPWFTGPLLAPSGHTIPKGHFNAEPYFFYTDNFGVYNHRWKLMHVPETYTLSVNPVLSWGLTDWMDMQTTTPYNFNWQNGKEFNDYGDFTILFGFQLATQQQSSWLPDIRFTVQESFPSGKFDMLNPAKQGTDATGSGAYQTAFSITFQHLMEVFQDKYIRTRLSLNTTLPSQVHLRGFNSYGGGNGTDGRLRPGKLVSADLAFEYTLTQHWVPVFEVLYIEQQASQFSGTLGFNRNGVLANVGHEEVEQLSLAPALEYNFSPNFGIIAGVWFTVIGRDTNSFISGVLAINYYM